MFRPYMTILKLPFENNLLYVNNMFHVGCFKYVYIQHKLDTIKTELIQWNIKMTERLKY
jgi:hypothetical protein